MSVREVGWIACLAGLPFAHFLSPGKAINNWYAQTFWAEAWIATLFGMAIMRGNIPAIQNRPFGCWVVWMSLSTIRIWMSYLLKDWGHPIGLLSPFVHALCLVGFYLSAVRDWTVGCVTHLFRWVAYGGVVVVAYGILQLVNLDQFYKFIDNTIPGKDSLIGTIGNPAYFGIHLALLLPIFLWQPERWWKGVAVVASLLLVLTLSTSALVCGLLAWFWWAWFHLPKKLWIGIAVVTSLISAWFIASHPFWSNPSGRLETWQWFWQHYLVGDGKQQITGAGLGRIMGDSHQTIAGWPVIGSSMFRHAHSEYFQALIEQGVFGLGIISWALWDALQRWRRLPRQPVVLMLGGIGLIFLAAACVNSPAHNWILGSFGLTAYSGIYALSAEG